MTVLDGVGSDGQTSSSTGLADELDLDTFSDDPEVFVLRAVKDDPFTTTGEIRRGFRQATGGKISRWYVFRVLRRHGLLRKKSRFRYAWGRS